MVLSHNYNECLAETHPVVKTELFYMKNEKYVTRKTMHDIRGLIKKKDVSTFK